jgi:hypothetical protein
MEEPWHYLIDQFVSSTVDNYKKTLKLSNYHHAFLNTMQIQYPSDPDWPFLYNRYDPFHQNFESAFSMWKGAGGTQKGQTANVSQLLKLLVGRAASWDIQVQNTPTFEKGSFNYITLFPNGRSSFNTGSKLDRIKAVEVLGNKLVNIPQFVTLGGIVQSFHTQLNTANDTQEGSKGLTRSLSNEVEIRRIETMTEQYRNLGFLINKSAEHPERIAPFFDLNVLRESNQVLFTGTLDPQETEPVLIHTFLADDELVLSIKGDPAIPAGTMVQFYLVPVAGGVNGTPVSVEANGAPLTITAADFGVTNYGTHRFLTAVNTHLLELHYEVELL